jgi:hypothetical protein
MMQRFGNDKNKTVVPPNVSNETMREMHKFFLRTSIPRLLAAEKIKKKNSSYEGIEKEKGNTHV